MSSTHACTLSRVWLSVAAETVARQAPLSMGFPRQKYWSGLTFSFPGNLPDPGIKPGSPVLGAWSLSHWTTKKVPWGPLLIKLFLFLDIRKDFVLLCPSLCDPMGCSPTGSPVHGISQAKIQEWVAISSSRRSSSPRDQTRVSWVSCTDRWIQSRD